MQYYSADELKQVSNIRIEVMKEKKNMLHYTLKNIATKGFLSVKEQNEIPIEKFSYSYIAAILLMH